MILRTRLSDGGMNIISVCQAGNAPLRDSCTSCGNERVMTENEACDRIREDAKRLVDWISAETSFLFWQTVRQTIIEGEAR